MPALIQYFYSYQAVCK